MSVAGLPYERLTSAEIVARWPEWRLPSDAVGMFHAEAGIVDIRRATAAHSALARAYGVEFLANTTVRALEPRSAGIAVHTDDATYLAGSVVLCTGAWTQPLLATAGVDLPLVAEPGADDLLRDPRAAPVRARPVAGVDLARRRLLLRVSRSTARPR